MNSPRPNRFCFIAALLLAGLGLESPIAYSAANQRQATAVEDVIVRKEAKETGEVIGRFRKGTQLKVYFPDRGGWYAIYFAQPVKGTHYGWMPAQSLQLQENLHNDGAHVAPASGPSRSKTAPSGPAASSWVALVGEFGMIAPSALQTALGDPAKSLIAPSFGLEFGHIFPSRWLVTARAGSHFFSQALQSSSSLSYAVNGLELVITAGYALVRGPRTVVSLEAGGGASLGSAGNTSTSQEISTSPILSYPIVGKISLKQRLMDEIGLLVDAGFRLQSMSAVPLLVPPAGTTQTSADIALGGPFGSLGFAYRF